MWFAVIFILALTPGIFWMWQIYQRDKYRPEPRALVARTFLWGMAISIPVAIVERILYPGSVDTIGTGRASAVTIAYVAFVVAGLSEELGKYLVVKKTVYDSSYFDEPIDGLVYSSASALGFASIENVGYLFTFGWQTILVRGPVSTVAHVLFSAMWGYALGLKKVGTPGARALVWVGLIGSIATHGLFDFLLFSQNVRTLFVVPLFAGAAILFLGMLKHAQRISPFREKVGELLIACPSCGMKVAHYATFCTACGFRLIEVETKGQALCSRCGALVNREVNFCTSCGSRIKRRVEQ
ncbi:MAG: PrsW family intramembrane metalloprotease [Chloroflexi bacterium]|nr:PrsW family intramembrane metalloprotease [Chloroflexota bacterium]